MCPKDRYPDTDVTESDLIRTPPDVGQADPDKSRG